MLKSGVCHDVLSKFSNICPKSHTRHLLKILEITVWFRSGSRPLGLEFLLPLINIIKR